MTNDLEYMIGEWRFDVAGATVRGQAGKRRLEDRTARTLALLCRRRGETVPAKDILDEVWDGRAVSPNSVAVVIGDLRRSLGDDARNPVYIETVAKRGYRLANAPAAPPPLSGPAPTRRGRLLLAAGGLAALVLAATTVFAPRDEALVDGTTLVVVRQVANDTGHRGMAPLAVALGELVTTTLSHQPGIKVAVRSSDRTGSADNRLLLSSRLILWSGEPTLSMTATDPRGAIVWAGMATGSEDALASATIGKVTARAARIRPHGANAVRPHARPVAGQDCGCPRPQRKDHAL